MVIKPWPVRDPSGRENLMPKGNRCRTHHTCCCCCWWWWWWYW